MRSEASAWLDDWNRIISRIYFSSRLPNLPSNRVALALICGESLLPLEFRILLIFLIILIHTL